MAKPDCLVGLTTYQHHFIDMPTGALLGWLVLWAFPRQMTSPLKLGLSHARSQKIALLYLLGACLMVLPALLGGVLLWLIWISVSLLMVAFAYLTGNAAFFQKQANGNYRLQRRFYYCLIWWAYG